MQRRELLVGVACAGLLPLARAHHGWSSFDQERPIYLEGVVVEVRWRNPHAEFVLELAEGLRLPADLASRPLPAQTAGIDGPALLARTGLPKRQDRRWEVELAPLFRLGQWQLEEISPGTRLSVVGFTFKEERGKPLLRAEYLFLGDRAYGLRSSPA
ncbi:MAG TPA: DUF6152 family protein [Hydrogenophaga sp.]|uniref:DUF6152 family protein n=1 Tax=Hydrogenophaga sp. TaxID=1904254 RepID=UPI002BADFC98|nr:DUF6152 family protein [Hydrogenophaga sp.]HMN91590.1 DUF6152 family protein [Hydrogenophaga sp.]HMP10208.1 DUF6152 family protein [Hydrogenophaga sp.]